MTAADYNARRRQLRAGDRWHADEARQDELSRLFGGGCNPFGVFEQHETEELARVGKTFAAVHLVTGPAGLWLAASQTRGAMWYSGSFPSVWDVAHDTRQDARAYGILEALASIESHGGHFACKADAAQAAKLDRLLRAML